MLAPLALLLVLVTALACDYYLAPSLIPGAGLGIFAGRDFAAEEEIASGVTLIAPQSFVVNWQLNNYVYNGDHEGHSMLVFGMAMLLNHMPKPNTNNYWQEENGISELSEQTPFPFTVYRGQAYHAAQPIRQGEEIFGYYGDSDWFTDRGIAFNSSESLGSLVQEMSSLETGGFCLSDFVVGPTDIPFCGQGVFSTRSFSEGDLVSVSPALMLPREEVEAASGDTCVLINYCITDPLSNVALLPITNFGLLNHGSSFANLQMELYHWEGHGIAVENHSETTTQYADVYISYRATRNISAGEELLIDYGSAWVDKWNAFVESGGLFRAPIEAPEGMFPDQWKVTHQLEDEL